MFHNDNFYYPIICDKLEIKSLSDNLPLQIRMAQLWNKYIPRGKGWFPRFMGRFLGGKTKYYIRTKYGAYLAIEPSSLDIYTHMLNHGLTWDENVFNVCKSFLSDGSVFWDIGSNVGYMSIEMAKIFDDKISVFAFEPQPKLANIIALSANLNHFNRLKVFDVMLGDNIGQSDLFVGSHSIHASAIPRERNSICLQRRITTIDEMIRSGAILPPNVIKIDIEGGEFAAFSGAKSTISTYLPIIVFESDENMSRFGYSRRDLIKLLRKIASYNCYFINNIDGNLIEINDLNIEANCNDIVAIPHSI